MILITSRRPINVNISSQQIIGNFTGCYMGTNPIKNINSLQNSRYIVLISSI